MVKATSFFFRSHGLWSLEMVRSRYKSAPMDSSLPSLFSASHPAFHPDCQPPWLTVTSAPPPDAETPAFHWAVHYDCIMGNPTVNLRLCHLSWFCFSDKAKLMQNKWIFFIKLGLILRYCLQRIFILIYCWEDQNHKHLIYIEREGTGYGLQKGR